MTTEPTVIKEKIKAYIVNSFMDGEGSIGDDDQLFESGIIDSIGFIKLLSYIESTFHTPMDMSEFTVESGTINGMLEMIRSKF